MSNVYFDIAESVVGIDEVRRQREGRLLSKTVVEQERDKLRERVRELERDCREMRDGLMAVESLVNESSGVCGLHLNGDMAPWAELRADGRFHEWLLPFDAALPFARKYAKTEEG